nr:DUF2125 domain-containing protein [Parvularcula mediterranea]
MIIPFALLGVFAFGYTVLWNKGADAMKAELAAFADREAAQGRSFTYETIDVDGFPFNLRAAIAGADWQGERTRFQAEELMVATLPYDVSRILFVPRGEQVLTAFGTDYDLEAEDLVFSLEGDFMAAQGAGISLTSEARTVTVGELIANQQRLGLGRAIAVSVKAAEFGGEEQVQVPYFDMAASREANVFTVAAADLGIRRADDPSPTQLVAKGALQTDDQGLLNGELEIKFKNEPPLLGVLAETGAISNGEASMARQILGLLTDKGTKEQTLPLTVDEGEVRLGPVSIGEIPPL